MVPDQGNSGRWFPRWFFWPFMVIGFPIYAAKWVWRKVTRR